MRQHRFHRRLGQRVHREERDVGAGGARRGVRGGDRAVARRCAPALRLLADEGVDAAAVGAAVRVPACGVAQRQHVERMEADDRVDAVVIAPEAVDQFRSLHLLGGLAEKAQRAGEVRLLHGVLRGEDPGERADAERRVRVGVSGRKLGESGARAARRGRRLTVAGHGVVFGVSRHGGPGAVGPLRCERGGHAAARRLDREAGASQPVDEPRGRAVLAPRGLGEFPDRAMPFGERVPMPVDPGARKLFHRCHRSSPTPARRSPAPASSAQYRRERRWQPCRERRRVHTPSCRSPGIPPDPRGSRASPARAADAASHR